MSTSPSSAILAEPSDDLACRFMEYGPDVLVMLRPDGQCRHVTAASVPVLGRAPDTLAGRHLQDLVWEADHGAVGDLLDGLRNGAPSATATFRVQGAFGTWIWMEAHARRMPAGGGAVLALRDISARKEEEAVLVEANELLRRRATLDPVTSLPNRGHFAAALERELRRGYRDATPVSLIAVGIDEMRLFNDFYGRDAGDVALREVAAALGAALSRPGDLAGRVEGPALGIVLPGTDLPGAATVADRLRRSLAELGLEHAGLPSGRLTVTVSLVCAEGRTNAAALLREAACEMQVARAASLACLSPG